ncbi:hypothetical protein ACHAXA_009800 [Cyclostephanos tholiformis]|uniref:HSF-type DNA-binding domain-containing protein n=1 Tax=Cyclostephanos tholiformis TaxID=382380 RepID=A0ABD3RXM7_9STRA
MIDSSASSTCGGGSRRVVLHNYHDYGHTEQNLHRRNNKHRGKVASSFPERLHTMLSEVEDSGLTDIISWQPHGRCFVLHKPKKFAADVMPLYFRQSKITSFQRQLNLYGFKRITKGPDRGGYYHELFLRHKAFLCGMMPRFRVKGTGVKAKSNPSAEPDFYSMPFVKEEDSIAKLKRDLDDKTHLCTHPFLHANKQPENAVSHIKDHVADNSLAADASNNIAQARGSAKSSSFDLSSSSICNQSQSTNFCLSSYSRISNDDLTNWAEPAYESNPAAGPHFYSMPLIKAEDSPTKSNRGLDYKTHLCTHPFLHAKRQPENTHNLSTDPKHD